ncbi:MAG: hypothetical protein P4L90_09555 [Rhodopila sp.]|nr:hypothetical protein [Rhodopila sp.]
MDRENTLAVLVTAKANTLFWSKGRKSATKANTMAERVRSPENVCFRLLPLLQILSMKSVM